MNPRRLRPDFSELVEPFDVPIQGQNPRDDEQVPAVPFVPYRCPFCGQYKPKTEGGAYGRVRRHLCQACGRRYRSIEMPASCVPNWPALRVDAQQNGHAPEGG